MKIRAVSAYGLRGRTPEGGWSHELQPEDCVHTIIKVDTDEGLIGWGSVFTSEALVKAHARPLWTGGSAWHEAQVCGVPL